MGLDQEGFQRAKLKNKGARHNIFGEFVAFINMKWTDCRSCANMEVHNNPNKAMNVGIEREDGNAIFRTVVVKALKPPMLVCKVESAFDPCCMVKMQLSIPIPVPCFKVGSQSRCIREWTKPTREFEDFFHEVCIFKTKRGQKKQEVVFYYGKRACLPWDPNLEKHYTILGLH